MTTYGEYPGVKVTVAGGGITSIEVGSEEKVVIFGRGNSNADAPVNTPTQVQTRRGIGREFGRNDTGEDPELTRAMELALANGANISFLYGVRVDEGGVTAPIDIQSDSPTESFTSTSSDTLSNFPIVEDKSLIDVHDTVASNSLDVNFVYEDTVPQPSSGDTVNINPLNGKWTADSSSDYDLYYQYPEWEKALNAADTVVNEDETGLYVTLTESEEVAATLSGKVTSLRNNFQLVNGISAAEPNATLTKNAGTDSERDFAGYDTSSYDNLIDSDTQFLAAPVRLENSTRTVLGSIGGLFGGSAITEPIYNDTINTGGTPLEQSFTRTDGRNVRDAQVIPVRQAGAVRVKGNISTSTESDFERDFWRRRITDRAILIGKQIGDRIVGRINNQDTRNTAERAITAQLRSLANDGLIEPNINGEQNFFVDVTESPTNSNEVLIDIGITPVGIVKRVEETITINT